jgi:NAD(P)-dependent dehydrogenase (short-subunit alcohol dehydrogenase family)
VTAITDSPVAAESTDPQCHRLAGRAAIVTGGASGIGAATARRLVWEGARVTIGDINGAAAEALAKELGDSAQGIQFDAGDVVSVQELVDAAVSWAGRLDILHNNAAIMAPDHIARDTTPTEIDFEVWDKTFQVNVRGYLAGIKYAVPHMIASGGGSIVLTASGSASLGDLSNIAYGSSKGAIVTLTKYVATIYGQQGIRCNAINPGLIRTEGGKLNVTGPLVEVMERNTLAPRLGQPEDIAACVAYLASDDAAFVTGAILDVDGGMLCHMPYMSDILQLFGSGQAFGAAENDSS